MSTDDDTPLPAGPRFRIDFDHAWLLPLQAADADEAPTVQWRFIRLTPRLAYVVTVGMRDGVSRRMGVTLLDHATYDILSLTYGTRASFDRESTEYKVALRHLVRMLADATLDNLP